MLFSERNEEIERLKVDIRAAHRSHNRERRELLLRQLADLISPAELLEFMTRLEQLGGDS
jgi:hypothetical protein